MPDYQHSAIAGSKWKRCCRIVIENPMNAIPSVLFVEEEVINLGEGEPIARMVSNCSASLADPSEVIGLRNPETWELTGATVTMGELYVGIASAYWQKALERDNANNP